MIAFLQHLTNHLATNSLTNKVSKQDSEISFVLEKIWKNGAYLTAVFCLTLSSFHRAFNNNDYKIIVNNCFKLWQNWNDRQKIHPLLTENEFNKIMNKTTDIRLKQMIDNKLVIKLYKSMLQLFDNLFDNILRKDTKIEKYASLQIKESSIWLLLGLIRLHLLFPARFFDPNLKFKIRLNDCESVLTQLFQEIELRKRIELFQSGKSTNYTIKNLERKYQLLLKERLNLLSKVTYRPPSKYSFADFWHELTNFIENQFNCDELIQLFNKITNKNKNSDGNHYIYQQIQTKLQSSLNFTQRLNDEFSSFNDFVSPIIDAIELIRYGLSLCYFLQCINIKYYNKWN